MGRANSNNSYAIKARVAAFAVAAIFVSILFFSASGQYYTPTITPPPPAGFPAASDSSVEAPMPIPGTVPRTYDDLLQERPAYDLRTPSNITTAAEYDPATGCYVIHTRVGDNDIATPFLLTASQYENWQLRQSMQTYLRQRNLEQIVNG
ncbi:MAG: hypothetical protein ACI31C_07950, partial [Muribaculaceae bacterium]